MINSKVNDPLEQAAIQSRKSNTLIETVETLAMLLSGWGICLNDIEQIYDDKLYIDIIKVLTNERIDIYPQEKGEDKVENLRAVLGLLSTVVERNLGHINPHAIIFGKDEKFTQWLIELFISVIRIVKYVRSDMGGDSGGKKKLSKSHESSTSFIYKKLNDICGLEQAKDKDRQSNDNISEDYLMSFCPKPQRKSVKKESTSMTIDNSINDITDPLRKKQSSSNYSHYMQNNQELSHVKNQHQKKSKQKRSQSALQSHNYKMKSFYAFDFLPLTLDELRKEIVFQTKSILSPSKFHTLTHSKHSFNKSIEKIVSFLLSKYSKGITYNYIKQNLREIHGLIKRTFNQTNNTNNSDIIKQIAIAMINDHCILKNISDIESALTNVKIKSKKRTYQFYRKLSDSHITRVKQIYQTAYQYEEEKCIEEKNNLNALCERKEAKIVVENKEINEYFLKTKEYLEELERYRRFQREKELHLRKLKIITQ